MEPDASYDISDTDNISDTNSDTSEYLSDNDLTPGEIELNSSSKISPEMPSPTINDKILLNDTEQYNINLDNEEEIDDNMEEIPNMTNNSSLNNIILKSHPEILSINNKELQLLTKIKYNKDGIINDPLHKTTPILSKYEKTKIIGQRAKQIQQGAKPFIENHNIIDSYLIACMELEANKIPFIIKRPLPNNNFEYWKITDLLNLY